MKNKKTKQYLTMVNAISQFIVKLFFILFLYCIVSRIFFILYSLFCVLYCIKVKWKHSKIGKQQYSKQYFIYLLTFIISIKIIIIRLKSTNLSLTVITTSSTTINSLYIIHSDSIKQAKQQFLLQNSNQQKMNLHTFSSQYQHYSSLLVQTLKILFKQTSIEQIYFTQHTHKLLINERITQPQLFGCGFKKIYNRKSITPYLKLDKIIIVANIEQQQFQQINQFQYLFPQIVLLTLQMTNSSGAKALKNYPNIRKTLKVIKEINLNFFTFLDNAHYISKMQKSSLFKNQNQQKSLYTYKRPSLDKKIDAFRSFLLSYPKVYEYEFHFIKSNQKGYTSFVENLKNQLMQSLELLQKHEEQCKNFDKITSPKIKVLILNREVINDLISPLIYGYFYGSLCEEFADREKIIQGADKLSSKGKMYNVLFDKDFDQSAQYIKALTKDKAVLDGPFVANYFHKAKNIIANFEDPSPIELSIHISCWKQARLYGEQRVKAGIIQQDIANRKDQFGRKVSDGTAVSEITNWVLSATKQQQPFVTEQESMKLIILAQLTGKLWFYNRSSLKNILQTQSYKQKYQKFSSAHRQTIPVHTLIEKHQESVQDRSQLYRHEPSLIPVCQAWIKQTLGLQQRSQDKQKMERIEKDSLRKMPIQFEKIFINNDISKNRDSRLVILIDGIVGYNQLALLRRAIKKVTDKQVAYIAESYCNSQQYVDYLLRP